MTKPLPRETSDNPQGEDSDKRLYVPYPEGWEAKIKQGWDKAYCYMKNPGEDYFHLILNGEIYLEFGHEMYCLTCAMRQGILSRDRLNWQKSPRKEGNRLM